MTTEQTGRVPLDMPATSIAARANEAARLSRRSGAPWLTAESGLPALREWLAWNDPNGEWLNQLTHDDGLTLDDAWGAIEAMLP